YTVTTQRGDGIECRKAWFAPRVTRTLGTLSDVPVSTLGAFIEAAAAHRTADIAALAKFAGFSLSTARKAVPTLQTLGIVTRDGDGIYAVAVDRVARGLPDEARAGVIRTALLGYRAFEMLVEAVALGEKTDVAVRKTLLLLDLAESDASKLRTL